MRTLKEWGDHSNLVLEMHCAEFVCRDGECGSEGRDVKEFTLYLCHSKEH